jgi:hypothetical protein
MSKMTAQEKEEMGIAIAEFVRDQVDDYSDRDDAVMTAACACLHIATSVFSVTGKETDAITLVKEHFAKVGTTMRAPRQK